MCPWCVGGVFLNSCQMNTERGNFLSHPSLNSHLSLPDTQLKSPPQMRQCTLILFERPSQVPLEYFFLGVCVKARQRGTMTKMTDGQTLIPSCYKRTHLETTKIYAATHPPDHHSGDFFGCTSPYSPQEEKHTRISPPHPASIPLPFLLFLFLLLLFLFLFLLPVVRLPFP